MMAMFLGGPDVGVGQKKTQVAIAFSYWVRDNYSDVSVFWVHAASPDRFRQAFASIAEECRITGYDDSKPDVPMLVRRWLEKKERGRWVMIIDNADDKELFFPSESATANASKETSVQSSSRLGDYLPECAHGSILITTRDKKAASRFSQGKPSIIEIDKMDQSETGQLLQKMLGKEASLEEAASLSARLEYLPLALVQAAAFIQENSISISKYLQLLDESDETLVDQLSEPFDTVGRDSDVPNEVTATWIVSFDQIRKRDILASEILSFICLLDRQAIPEKYITVYCNKRYAGLQQHGIGEVTKAMGTLKAFSFVTESKDNTLDMHRLVQLVTRKWLIMRNEYHTYSRYAFLVVSTLIDSEKLQTQQDRKEESFREEHPSTMTSMANLAHSRTSQERWNDAIHLMKDCFRRRERYLVPYYPDTISSATAFSEWEAELKRQDWSLQSSCNQAQVKYSCRGSNRKGGREGHDR
ncbi:hypothetical protein LZ31DRAFT_608634 [Colletotrichum somersetense]|nr:hypothetical protein LZ31DRAFT_608634 [Colletotrichum somersetense]